MKCKKLHKWNVTPKEAIFIQQKLAENLPPPNVEPVKVAKIAGCDVSFRKQLCCAAVVVLSYPELLLLEQKTKIAKITFPYIPTLLTFREGRVVIDCFKTIKTKPDVVLFDGQGITHPRRMGLATHMGLWLDIPSIGCAKTPLYGKFNMPGTRKGSYSPIVAGGECIGTVLRTRKNTKPIFVSQGYKITLKNAMTIVLNSCPKFRIPEPLRTAHILAKTTLV